MTITVRQAMRDLREAFLGNIYKGYPDHKKMWKAEDVDKELTSAMYDLAIYYFATDKEKEEDWRNG